MITAVTLLMASTVPFIQVVVTTFNVCAINIKMGRLWKTRLTVRGNLRGEKILVEIW